MEKIKIGMLGATGMVGQNYIRLLENHPWFEVNYVAASPKNAGKTYEEAVEGKWMMDSDIPSHVKNLIVGDANKLEQVVNNCQFVFSAIEGDKETIQKLEMAYAAAGIPVVSNNSAHRWTEDVPMLIPEINPEHLNIIEYQQKHNGWNNGFIVVKPNCSIQSYMIPVHALMRKGYIPKRIIVTTEQALSGGGYPGVASLDIIDNIIPYITGEAEKTEKEPFKIFGSVSKGKIIPYKGLSLSATCTRVNVRDGHTSVVNIEFGHKKPNLEEIINIWANFRGIPQEYELPSAPSHPIIYRPEENRPQPRKDRDAEKGMAITVGRLRKCDVLDYKFVGLSHNTIRGAAGGAILTAELLKTLNYLE
jgi:aspartate-semialdehyde dehydrogenase